jgi:hypothetical protein
VTCWKERELRRKWTASLVVLGFIVGLGLCLTIAHDDSHHDGSKAPWTLTHTSQACGISVVPCSGQSGSSSLPLILSLHTEHNTLYEGVSIRPPSPPPRV